MSFDRPAYFLSLFVLLLLSCVSKEKSPQLNEIEIEVNSESQYLINQKLVSNNKIEEVLSSEKERLTNAGIKEADITIILSVDENAKRGSLSDLEAALRQLNLKKIRHIKNLPKYSSDPSQTS
jgi:biopolymer transport protein ExbD